MPSWIINGNIEEVEREGAAARLSYCQEFMPARSALELLESGVPPSAVEQGAPIFSNRKKNAFRARAHKSSDPHKYEGQIKCVRKQWQELRGSRAQGAMQLPETSSCTLAYSRAQKISALASRQQGRCQ